MVVYVEENVPIDIIPCLLPNHLPVEAVLLGGVRLVAFILPLEQTIPKVNRFV